MEFVYKSFLLAFLVHCVATYPEYRKHIPNGFSVPFPCKPGETWLGVGHYEAYGMGDLNPFGNDFFLAYHIWTEELCRKDSDGDGVPNGVELGDPDCVWHKEEKPKFPKALSHPGICDPWNSTYCQERSFNGTRFRTQKQWLDYECNSPDFKCPALAEEEMKAVTIRLPSGSVVPAEETAYKCIVLDLASLGIPLDRDFHLVAITPSLDKHNLTHHMSLSACKAIWPAPFECKYVVSPQCPEFFHLWTMGVKGHCFDPFTGIMIGPNGIKKLVLQVHWNNPELISGLTDTSGLVLHYTPVLRPHDAGVLITGSSMFSLPLEQPEVLVKSTCSGQCTHQQMTGPVNITSAWNHMHYSGIKMNIEVTWDKHHVTNITDDREYDYNRPIVHRFSDQIVFNPGDELHTNCVFSTVNSNRSILSGYGARDEMCLGFIYYFPKRNMTMSTCLDNLGCKDLPKFVEQINSTQVFQQVLENCQSFIPCLTECLQTVVKKVHAMYMLTVILLSLLQNVLTNVPEGRLFLSRLASCQVEVYLALNSTKNADLN
ncbi:unnamed protein product [Candidula unifasciata]|uniref:Temptin n=1 Tax=Candidula unifasciata TaxID=100452 RepID=A0A8S3ZPG9_9EUPU|nr:unnamed protein product [Candidula unifasciata]